MRSTMTSQDFNHDIPSAKRTAENGPVTIMDTGTPSHVLPSYSDDERLSGKQEFVDDRLWRDQDPTIDLPLPERKIESAKKIDW